MLTELDDGDRSIRSMKKEWTQRRKRGLLQIQPFGDCWIEQAMRRKYVEGTKKLDEQLERRNEVLVVSGGALDTGGSH